MWATIPKPFNSYEVNKAGCVRNATTGQILKPFAHVRGYRVLTIVDSVLHTKRHAYVHRLVLSAFVGPCPIGYETNHIDGNKANNALENLEYITRSENHLHRYRVLCQKFQGGIAKRGEQNQQSKLTDAKVLSIRSRSEQGETRAALARQFGVSGATVSAICLRRIWTHI